LINTALVSTTRGGWVYSKVHRSIIQTWGTKYIPHDDMLHNELCNDVFVHKPKYIKSSHRRI